MPRDVVHILVDPSVTLIPAGAFAERNNLAEVELSEGVVEIGDQSFRGSSNSITKINIPNSLRRINNAAFLRSLRCPIHLHDGIESIGKGAFNFCVFTNFRFPPLITVISQILHTCQSMFSLEIPVNVTEVEGFAFYNCFCLRNVAFPPDAVFGHEIFGAQSPTRLVGGQSATERTDLYQLFGSIADMIRELQHRFDGLPIHKLVYYQSYYQGVLQMLITTINMTSGQRQTLRSMLDPTGNQQDCLGMTPLHILACSFVHDLELYRVIVEKYPANLITEDRWGALPLLYAFWGTAPSEIIQFLLESYLSLYPDHVFNWTMMVETIGRCDTPKESIENILRVKQMHFPEQQLIDWDYLLDKISGYHAQLYFTGEPFQEKMRFLIMCGMGERIEALAFNVWRDQMKCIVHSFDEWDSDRSGGESKALRFIKEKLAYFEDEFPKLKEITTILELVLWKMRLNENSHQIKTDESSMRRQCRVTCGADVVIRHVLPYLITVGDEATSSADGESIDEGSW